MRVAHRVYMCTHVHVHDADTQQHVSMYVSTSGVGRFPEVVRPTQAAHAQKSYTTRRKARPRDMRMLDAH